MSGWPTVCPKLKSKDSPVFDHPVCQPLPEKVRAPQRDMGWSGDKLIGAMPVYTAYSDESGVADPTGEFLVCGYLGTEPAWDYVRRAWQERVLDGPVVGLFEFSTA
jgi:hypothetical protein